MDQQLFAERFFRKFSGVDPARPLNSQVESMRLAEMILFIELDFKASVDIAGLDFTRDIGWQDLYAKCVFRLAGKPHE